MSCVAACAVVVLAWVASAADAPESATFLKGGVRMDVNEPLGMETENARHEAAMKEIDDLDQREVERHQKQLEAIEKKMGDSGPNPKAREAENRTHEKRKQAIEKLRKQENEEHARKKAGIMAAARKLAQQASADAAGGQGGSHANQNANKSRNTSAQRSTGAQDHSRAVTAESSSHGESRGGTASTSGQGNYEPGSIPDRLMKLAAEMDRMATGAQNNAMAAGNEFFKGMADSVSRTAKFMSQKPGVVVPQMMDGVIQYLTSDYNENNQKLYDGAAQAVEEIQKNPARFFGEHAIDAAMAATGAAGEIAGARAATAAGEAATGARVAREIGAAEKTGQTAKGVEQAGEGQAARRARAQQADDQRRRAAEQQRQGAKRAEGEKGKMGEGRASTAGSDEQAARRARAQQQAEQQRRQAAVQQRLQQSEQTRKGTQGREDAGDTARLEDAGQTLKGMAEGMAEFEGFGAAGWGPPDLSDLFPRQPGVEPQVNIVRAIDKNAGNANCFPVALAAAKRWRTGKPYVALDANPHMPPSFYDPASRKFVHGDVPTSGPKISEVLKNNFGKGKARDPMHGDKGLRLHEEGCPVLSSKRQIEDAFDKLEEGCQGLVFVDNGRGTPSHVFNCRKVNNKVEYWDYQADPPIQILDFGNGKVTASANGVTKTVDAPWTRTFFYRLD